MVRNIAPVIMAAVRHARPAIIPAGQDQIDLVSALRAHFAGPQPAVGGEAQPQHVAMADRPELRGDTTARSPGIARRRRAFVRQAKYLAQVHAHVLGWIELLPLT